MTKKDEELIKYEIVYNRYQQMWVVFRTDYLHLNVRSVFRADTRKECVEWLRNLGWNNGRY